MLLAIDVVCILLVGIRVYKGWQSVTRKWVWFCILGIPLLLFFIEDCWDAGPMSEPQPSSPSIIGMDLSLVIQIKYSRLCIISRSVLECLKPPALHETDNHPLVDDLYGTREARTSYTLASHDLPTPNYLYQVSLFSSEGAIGTRLELRNLK